MRSPIWWYGGKGNMVAKLLAYIPECQTYVEAYGGGASLLFGKEPSPVEVYNDLDSGLVSFFRMLRDPEKFAKFYHLASLTPYSREEYCYCRETWKGTEDEVEKAYKWFVVARMSFGGMFGSGWGFNKTTSTRGMASTVSKWISILELLPAIADRMMRVQIEHNDALKVIQTYDTEETFFYLDPPYVHSTRKCRAYQHEMNDDEHIALLETILDIQGMALLSGYHNDIYDTLLKDWSTKEWQTACHSAGRTKATGILGKGAALEKQPRTEVIWYNEACKDALDKPSESLF